MPFSQPGRILTFYSYKGGTGRSMALANAAWILACQGKQVLAIDWDLEAPGLHRYFRPFLIDEEMTSSEGLIDLIDAYANEAIRPVESTAAPDAEWYLPYADFTPYVLSLNFDHFPEGGKIDFLPAGRQGEAYAVSVSSFNWQNFYDRLGGGGFIEAIREKAQSLYDYILIDSRTGVSDTAGICSVQMPDTLVVCFTYNNQSIKGAAAVCESAIRARRKLLQDKVANLRVVGSGSNGVIDTPFPFRIFPVPMRVDTGESERLAIRQTFAQRAFGGMLTHLGESEVAEYWRNVEVPYNVFYSYEEVLAPFKDDFLDPKSMLAAFIRLTRYLAYPDTIDYKLPITPEVKLRYIEAFAETPLTVSAKRAKTAARTESEEEELVRIAESAMAGLSDRDKALARNTFSRLVRLGRDEEGGGLFPIRANTSDFSEDDLRIIQQLTRFGLLTVITEPRSVLQAPGSSSDRMVAFADERLLKLWKTLRAWLDGDREFLLWRQQLRTYMADWQRSGADDEALLSGRLLSEADLWALKRADDLNSAELRYVATSRAYAGGERTSEEVRPVGRGEVIGAGQKTDLMKAIAPTILIGLGGTGKEVLLRIRQRFFERYNVKGFPVLAYLCVDTDMQNVNLDGKTIDYIDQEVRFRNDEVIDAQISAREFFGYFQNKLAHPHIFSWMYSSLATLGSVQNGSRQIRALGRLSFFHAFSRIKSRLTAMERDVLWEGRRRETENTFGVKVGPALSIVIVASIAGGTGSGMFLDMSFFCRKQFPNADIVGYLVLPSVFAPHPENNEPIYANAYAALKELEFYSMRKDFLETEIQTVMAEERRGSLLAPVSGMGAKVVSAHDFEVEWIRGDSQRIVGPPFNACYLIDNRTARGGSIRPTKKTDLCDMIAESIFIEYSNYEFSARKRSVRSNLEGYLGNELKYEYLARPTQQRQAEISPEQSPIDLSHEDQMLQREVIHTEIFSCRFSAMGFSKIFLPIDRIRRTCGYTLASEMIGQFLRRNNRDATLEDDLRTRELGQLYLREQDFASLEYVNDEEKTFGATIEGNWVENESQLTAEASKQPSHLTNMFMTMFDEYNKTQFDQPPDPNKWGAFIRRLKRVNQPQFIERAHDTLRHRVNAWLDTPRIRLDLSIDNLVVLQNILRKQAEGFREKAEGMASVALSLNQEIRILLGYMQDEANGWMVQRLALKALVHEACLRTRNLFKTRLLAHVYKSCAEVCDELQGFIGFQDVIQMADGTEVVRRSGLIQEVSDLRGKLSRIRDEIDRKVASCERTEDHLIFVNLYKPGMFRDYYRLADSKNQVVAVELDKNENQLRELEQEYKAYAKINHIAELNEAIDRLGTATVEQTLTAYTLQKFKNITVEADALKLFFDVFGDQLEERVSKFVTNGSPWVIASPTASIENVISSNYEEDAALGLSALSTNHQRYDEFVSKMRSAVASKLSKVQLGPEVEVESSAIYFYSEIAGIPLLFIDGLDRYKDVYLKRVIGGRPHHLMRHEDRFADILTKAPDEIEQTIRIHGVLILGTILKIVDVNQNTEVGTFYSYRDIDAVPPPIIPLGGPNMAVETLRSRTDRLEFLERKVAELRGKLTLEGRKRLLIVLLYHIMDGREIIPGSSAFVKEGPFAPRFLNVAGRKVEHSSLEFRAFFRLREQEVSSICDATGGTRAEVYQSVLLLYSTLDDFSETIPVGTTHIRRLKTVETAAASLQETVEPTKTPGQTILDDQGDRRG